MRVMVKVMVVLVIHPLNVNTINHSIYSFAFHKYIFRQLKRIMVFYLYIPEEIVTVIRCIMLFQ